MADLVARFSTDESGATAIEYALLATFIFLAIVAATRTLGTSLSVVMENVSAKL